MADITGTTDEFEAYYPQPSTERIEAEKVEALALSDPATMVSDVLAWFDEQIKNYDSTTSISGINPSTKAEDVKAAVLLAQTLLSDYKDKRNTFATKYGDNLRGETTI